MYYLDKQYERDGSEIYKVKTNFNLPIRKDRHGNDKIPSGTLLYTCMTSDFFLDEADEWRQGCWDMIRERSDLDFVIITRVPVRANNS